MVQKQTIQHILLQYVPYKSVVSYRDIWISIWPKIWTTSKHDALSIKLKHILLTIFFLEEVCSLFIDYINMFI